MSYEELVCFTNCHSTRNGELISEDVYFSSATGLITPNYYYRSDNVTKIDLTGKIVAPGYLELQSNGMGGIHFTQLANGEEDESRLQTIARMQVKSGVTGWWATVPTVAQARWKEILPALAASSFASIGGADLLGAHVEGPYLHPTKKGAHNDAYFCKPEDMEATQLYGSSNLRNIVKMVTLAPELPGSVAMIGSLLEDYPALRVSLGHSTATYEDGASAVGIGATMLTHTFNAMAPLHHRDPGLAGLMTSGRVWYSIIPDGIHLHPSVLSLAFRADPSKCILITDNIELAGMPDGVYPPNGQIMHRQRKVGNKVVIDGTDTLIGSCCMLDEIVRNMLRLGRCSLAEAVRCVTENIADMMGEGKRGHLEPGRRADFVILDPEGFVEQTWNSGVKVWDRQTDEGRL
jgi:N-acetylglucosamine-6-phosphate deacetylase